MALADGSLTSTGRCRCLTSPDVVARSGLLLDLAPEGVLGLGLAVMPRRWDNDLTPRSYRGPSTKDCGYRPAFLNAAIRSAVDHDQDSRARCRARRWTSAIRQESEHHRRGRPGRPGARGGIARSQRGHGVMPAMMRDFGPTRSRNLAVYERGYRRTGPARAILRSERPTASASTTRGWTCSGALPPSRMCIRAVSPPSTTTEL